MCLLFLMLLLPTAAASALAEGDTGLGEWEPCEWLPVGVAMLEGAEVRVKPDPLCFDEVEIEWEVPTDPRLDCEVERSALVCIGVDDVVLTVAAEALADDGTLIERREIEVTVVNVAPTIESTDFGGSTIEVVTARVGDDFAMWLVAEEPGDDTVVFERSSGPPGLSVSRSGLVQWRPTGDQEGPWILSVLVSDEDGGSSTYDLLFYVVDDRAGLSCCSTSAALFFLVGLAPLRRSRRQGLG